MKKIVAKQIESGNEIPMVANGVIAAANIPVALRSDGKVEIVAQVGTATPTFGNEATFNGATTSSISSIYDSTTKTIAIFYSDAGIGKYVVGDVNTSTKTITWGTEGTFNATTTSLINAKYINATKTIVITFRDVANSNAGAIIVGTLDATSKSIAFGTKSSYTSSVDNSSIIIDDGTNTIVLIYAKGISGYSRTGTINTVARTVTLNAETTYSASSTGNVVANYLTASKAIIVSFVRSLVGYYRIGILNTTTKDISWGSENSYVTGDLAKFRIVVDETEQKAIFYYYDDTLVNTKYRVGEIDSITKTIYFGAEAIIFAMGNFSVSAVYNAIDKTIIFQQGGSNGAFVAGTVDFISKTITFASVFNFNQGSTTDVSSSFDESSKLIITAYADTAASSFGNVITYTKDGYTSNASKFLGFSGNAATDGQNVAVKLGGSKLSGFSGLTPALPVYISDGGVVSHNNTTYPKVGVALSATEILVANNSI